MATPKRPQLDKGATKNPFADANNAKYAYNRGVAKGYNHIEGSTPKRNKEGGYNDPGFHRQEGNGGMIVDIKKPGGRP